MGVAVRKECLFCLFTWFAVHIPLGWSETTFINYKAKNHYNSLQEVTFPNVELKIMEKFRNVSFLRQLNFTSKVTPKYFCLSTFFNELNSQLSSLDQLFELYFNGFVKSKHLRQKLA